MEGAGERALAPRDGGLDLGPECRIERFDRDAIRSGQSQSPGATAAAVPHARSRQSSGACGTRPAVPRAPGTVRSADGPESTYCDVGVWLT